MNNKKLSFLFVFFIIQAGQLMSQSTARHEFRLGFGPSLLGTGDMRCLAIENEYNYRLNSYFKIAAAVQVGSSENGVFIHSNFRQAGLNLYLSPFKNTGKGDFRIGTGLNYYRAYNVYAGSTTIVNGVIVDETIVRGWEKSAGVAIQMEYSRMVTSALSLGLKAYSNPYFNGDIQSGILLRAGILF
jgi:hypothetical protein